MKFSGFLGALKTYWLPTLLLVVVAVLFVSAPILAAYAKLRSLPGGSVLPAPKS